MYETALVQGQPAPNAAEFNTYAFIMLLVGTRQKDALAAFFQVNYYYTFCAVSTACDADAAGFATVSEWSGFDNRMCLASGQALVHPTGLTVLKLSLLLLAAVCCVSAHLNYACTSLETRKHLQLHLCFICALDISSCNCTVQFLCVLHT